jgi:hypothetical protein
VAAPHRTSSTRRRCRPPGGGTSVGSHGTACMPRMQHADHDADAGMLHAGQCRGNGYCIKQGQNSSDKKLTHRSDMTVATRPTGLR